MTRRAFLLALSVTMSDGEGKTTATESHEAGEIKHRGKGSSAAAGGASPATTTGSAVPEKKTAGLTSTLTIPQFVKDPSNPVGWLVSTGTDFASDSVRLVRRCTKPDAREFRQIAWACGVGFILMGFIGYIVKLIFIPINNIIVGG